jgi:hypothetical protein
MISTATIAVTTAQQGRFGWTIDCVEAVAAVGCSSSVSMFSDVCERKHDLAFCCVLGSVTGAAEVRDGLRDLLLTLSPTARDKLRRILIFDQPDRQKLAAVVLPHGDGWAGVVDIFMAYPEVRRKVVRLLAES